MQFRILALAALLALAVTPVATQQPAGCVPDGKIQFICGIPSPEDLVPVPRSEWVVVSGYIRGGVSLVNTKTFAATQVFPVAKPRRAARQEHIPAVSRAGRSRVKKRS